MLIIKNLNLISVQSWTYLNVGSTRDLISQKICKDKQYNARLILRERPFEETTWQEPIKQDRNSGQLFRPSWDSSALCSEDM